MTEYELKHAMELSDKIRSIKREIQLWGKEINRASDLAYRQSWNSDHATALNSNMDACVFVCFRAAVLDNLQTQLLNAESDFKKL